jgi:hypothetical protein
MTGATIIAIAPLRRVAITRAPDRVLPIVTGDSCAARRVDDPWTLASTCCDGVIVGVHAHHSSSSPSRRGGSLQHRQSSAVTSIGLDRDFDDAYDWIRNGASGTPTLGATSSPVPAGLSQPPRNVKRGRSPSPAQQNTGSLEKKVKQEAGSVPAVSGFVHPSRQALVPTAPAPIKSTGLQSPPQKLPSVFTTPRTANVDAMPARSCCSLSN